MVLFLWLSLIFYVLAVVLFLVWFATGRRNQIIIRIGAVLLLLGIGCTLYNRFNADPYSTLPRR